LAEANGNEFHIIAVPFSGADKNKQTQKGFSQINACLTTI